MTTISIHAKLSVTFRHPADGKVTRGTFERIDVDEKIPGNFYLHLYARGYEGNPNKDLGVSIPPDYLLSVKIIVVANGLSRPAAPNKGGE